MDLSKYYDSLTRAMNLLLVMLFFGRSVSRIHTIKLVTGHSKYATWSKLGELHQKY